MEILATNKEEKRRTARAWLLQMLAQVELADDIKGDRYESGSTTTISINIHPEK